MLHLFNRDVWGPLWPNLVADLISFAAGFTLAHRKLLRALEKRELDHLRRHREVIQAIEDASPGLKE